MTNVLGPEKFGDKKIWVQNIVVQNNFGSNFFLDPYRQLPETLHRLFQTLTRHTPDTR